MLFRRRSTHDDKVGTHDRVVGNDPIEFNGGKTWAAPNDDPFSTR